jgi:uncharacterized protein (TIGR02117 family)
MSKRRNRKGRWIGRLLTAVLAVPAAYMVAALAGSLVPANRGWTEPDEGITIYLADNGIHTDIVMPASADGLDWSGFVPKTDFPAASPGADWLAFGAGEENVYLDTPTWWDITPATIWSALTGSKKVLHVEWVEKPVAYATHEVRLRPAEYRRLWAAIRSDFERGQAGKPVRIDHPGYGCCDGFYRATGRFSAVQTCNSWVASRLRLAGVRTGIWPPFVEGLLWRYRRVAPAG